MRRHPLHWCARLGRPRVDADALLGDLQQQWAAHRAAGRSRPVLELWYLGQLLAAGAYALRARIGALLRPRVFASAKYALRRWRHRPGFALAAIGTLALGIATATALFSIVDAVLLRPLPWKDPGSLVIVHGVYPERRARPATATTWNRGTLSYPVWDALRASPAFSAVATYRPQAQPAHTLEGDGTRVFLGMDVSSNFLAELGVPIVLGRAFSDREDNVPSDSLLISHSLWQSRFGGRDDIIGLRVRTGRAGTESRQTKTVIGVVGPGFTFGGATPEVFEPVGISAAVNRQYYTGGFRMVARLAPGATAASAEAMVSAVVAATHMPEPASARLVPLAQEHLGAPARSLWLLFGGAGLLWLVACANVAGLILSDARSRRHEVAVRATLGGARGQIARLLMVEYFLLAAVGTAAGLVVAYWLLGALVAIAPEGLPRLDTVTVDLRVAVFAGAGGLLTFVLFGLMPAFAVARTPIAPVLAEGGRDGRAGRLWAQRAIVTGELALALVLVTAAWLFGETILRLIRQPLGFSPERVAVLTTTLTGSQIDPSTLQRLFSSPPRDTGVVDRRQAIEVAMRDTANGYNDRALAALTSVPGVVSAAGTSGLPFVSAAAAVSIVIDGRPAGERHDVTQQRVTLDYFHTLRIPITQGRGFAEEDRGVALTPGGTQYAVVSDTFARRFFPDGALGGRFRYVYGGNFELAVPYEIIGVARDVKRAEVFDDPQPLFYADARSGGRSIQFVVRTEGPPGPLLPSLRAAMADRVPELVVLGSDTMDDRVARSVAEERFRATLSALFGLTALLLSAVGLYGLAARRAAERQREFAVRVALGARPADVRRLVLRDALVIVTVGLAAGVPAAWWTAQLAQSLLFGVEAGALRVFATTAGLLSTVALLATALPARRAARANPIDVIRN